MNQVAVWYDGACLLCIREIALMDRLDRNGFVTFVDSTNPGTSCLLDRSLMLERFHAEENGRLLSGAAAFAAMWRALPLLRPLGLAARNRWILSLLEHGYRMFLHLRPRLQRFAGGRIET